MYLNFRPFLAIVSGGIVPMASLNDPPFGKPHKSAATKPTIQLSLYMGRPNENRSK